MLWRRSYVGFSLALAPLLAPSFAQAQGGAPPPAASDAPSASPSSTASSPPAAQRPSLIPDAPASITPTPAAPPSMVNPAHDQQELAAQGTQRPAGAGELPGSPQDVFSDDWWGKARPIVELHGYFRTRAELFHNFYLGRHGSTAQQTSPVQGTDGQFLFPIPADNSYQLLNGTPVTVAACGSATSTVLKPSSPCSDKTIATANLRLRLDP